MNPLFVKHSNPFRLAACCSSLMALFSVPQIAWAEPTASNEIEIIITAGRKAQTADETLAPVSIITRKEIEASQASSIMDVLRQSTGISITNSGGVGKQSSLHVRGTNDKHVLVLIDGVKIGSATLGTTAFEYLPLDQVERIEVVRGPRSSLYGSEAIGGVVQIFTRKGSGGKGLRPEASVSYGSHNTRKATANLSAGTGAGGWFNVGVATERTDGINVQDSYTAYPPPDFAPTDVAEPDQDGYQNNNISVRAGQRFANGAQAEVGVLHAEGYSEYDGALQNKTDFKQQVLNGKVSMPFGNSTVLSAHIGQSRDEQDSYKDGVYSSTFNTRRTTATVQADVGLGEAGNLTAGFDHQRDSVESNTQYTVNSRKNDGLFANYQIGLGDNKLDVSARQDDNQQFGKKTTGGVAVARELGGGIRATASYGTAFNAPTFNDLYYPFGGNAQLTPENSRHLELGVAGRLSSGEWAVNAFHNKIDDLIEWQDTGNGVWLPMNVDTANIKGLELSASQGIGEWQVGGNITLQKPEIASGSNQGNRLAYRPERILNIDLDRSFGKLSVGASVHAESQRYTDAFNSGQLAGYGTLDLRAKYTLSRDVAVGVKLANVLDKDYKMSRGYNQDGINGLLTLEYKPK